MFPDFPDFVPLKIELKEPYDNIVGEFPPYSDISFITLQTWWDLSEKLFVSLLNGNLVIDYNLPFDKTASGLGLIGKNNIDKSIVRIFDYLKQSGKEIRLVHVPEFAVGKIENPERFNIVEEHNYNEYILDSKALSNLEGHEYQLLRKKIKRFVKSTGERKLELKTLDLSLAEVQDQLFASILDWEKTRNHQNDPEHNEHRAIKKTLDQAKTLDIKNLAVYIDGKLHGIIIYHQPAGKDCFILHHAKVNYESPYIYDFLHHEVAKYAVKNNVSYLNIEMDLGIENLKKHKYTLRPSSFLKKYTIYPQ